MEIMECAKRGNIENLNTCIYCGCTDLNGCSNGCWWIDTNKSVCSNCSDFGND